MISVREIVLIFYFKLRACTMNCLETGLLSYSKRDAVYFCNVVQMKSFWFPKDMMLETKIYRTIKSCFRQSNGTFPLAWSVQSEDY